MFFLVCLVESASSSNRKQREKNVKSRCAQANRNIADYPVTIVDGIEVHWRFVFPQRGTAGADIMPLLT